MKEREFIEKVFKKTDLNAKNIYQYSKLVNARFYFVSCEYKELQDEVEFKYDITKKRSIKECKDESLSLKYALIAQLIEAIILNEDYCFSIAPDNVYVDLENRITILNRDISTDKSKNILPELRAFAAYLIQSKYTYEDYIKGGEKLLSYNNKTGFLLDISDLTEGKEIFEDLYIKELNNQKNKFICVSGSSWRFRNMALVVSLLLFLSVSVFSAYQNHKIIKPQQSALSAERFYIEKELIKVIDTLREIPIGELDKHEKYILAVSYIRSQAVDAFDSNIKNKLVDRLSYEGDENLLDYWIFLGRLEVDNAIDVAIRINDNQLLLYAYIQKLDVISADKNMSGDVKAQQLEALRSNIKNLADNIGIEYKDNESDSTGIETESSEAPVENIETEIQTKEDQ